MTLLSLDVIAMSPHLNLRLRSKLLSPLFAPVQAEQAKILAAKRAEADAKKKKMADAMQENYMNWHNKEEAVSR